MMRRIVLVVTAALVMAAMMMVAMAMPALAKTKSEVYECNDGQLVLNKETAKQIEKTSPLECKRFKA